MAGCHPAARWLSSSAPAPRSLNGQPQPHRAEDVTLHHPGGWQGRRQGGAQVRQASGAASEKKSVDPLRGQFGLGEAAADPCSHRPGEVARLDGERPAIDPGRKAALHETEIEFRRALLGSRDLGTLRRPARAWPRSPSTAACSRVTRSGRAQSRITSSISRKIFAL